MFLFELKKKKVKCEFQLQLQIYYICDRTEFVKFFFLIFTWKKHKKHKKKVGIIYLDKLFMFKVDSFNS